MIRPGLEDHGTDGSGDKLGQHILRVVAGVLRTSRQGCHSRIAGCEALPLGGQSAVRRTGANNDPVFTIAIRPRESEGSREGCAGLQLDRVATLGAVQCSLQVAAGIYADDRSWRRLSAIDLATVAIGSCAGPS